MYSKEEFLNNVHSILAKQEPIRKNVLKSTIWWVYVFLLIIFISFYVFRTSPEGTIQSDIAPFVFCFASILLFSFVYYRNKTFKEFLKDKCYKQIQDIFNLVYNNDKSEIENILIGNNIFSSFNKVEADDNIVGVYKGVKYTLAEVELIDVQRSGGKTEEYGVFKGLIIFFTSNKNIKSETLISPKRDYNILNFRRAEWINIIIFGILSVFLLTVCIKSFIIHAYAVGLLMLFLVSIPLSYLIPTCIGYYKNQKKLKIVKLEDNVFCKSYKIYSEDQVGARYLITTSFMERFKNLKTAFGNKNVKCSFHKGGNIIFVIPSKRDLFELGSLFSPLTKNNKCIERFYDEIKSIYDMIDYFKLNERTGL